MPGEDDIDLSGLYEPETPAKRPPAPASVKTHAESMPFLEAAAIGNKINPEDRMSAARALYGDKAIIERDNEGGIVIRKPSGEVHYIEEPTIAPWNPNTWTKENLAQLSEPILSRGATALAGAAIGAAAGAPAAGVGAIPGAAIGTLAGLFAGSSVQNLLAAREAGGSSAGPLDLATEGAKDVIAGKVFSKAAPVVGRAFKNVFTPAGRAASKVGQAFNALHVTPEGSAQVARTLEKTPSFNMTEEALPPAQVLADASPEAPSALNKMLSNSARARGLEEAGTRNLAQAAENIRSANVKPEIEAAMRSAMEKARSHPEIAQLLQEKDLAQAGGNTARIKEIDARLNELAHPFIPDVEGATSAAREGYERGAANSEAWKNLKENHPAAYDKFKEEYLKPNKAVASVKTPTSENNTKQLGENIFKGNTEQDVFQGKTQEIPRKPSGSPPEFVRPQENINPQVREVQQGFQAKKDAALEQKAAAEAGQSYTPGHEQILNGTNETLGVRAAQAKGTPLAPALRSRIAQKATPGKFNNNIVDALRADGSEEAQQLLGIDEYMKKLSGNAKNISGEPQHSMLGKLFVRSGRATAAIGTGGLSEGALFARRFFSNDRALRKVVESPELRTQLYSLIKNGKSPEEIGKYLSSGILGDLTPSHKEEEK